MADLEAVENSSAVAASTPVSAAAAAATDASAPAPAAAAAATDATDAAAAAPAAAAAAATDATAATAPNPAKKDTGRWLALESAPEVINPFLKGLGVDPSWGFCDVYGTDPELLGFVPKPCVAVCLLFPSTPSLKEYKKQQHARIVAKGQKTSDNLFYITQLKEFGNACGTIAALHAVANSVGVVQVDKGLLTKFMKATVGLSANDRGKALFECKAIKDLTGKSASSDAASTRCPSAEEKVAAHFISFVQKDGELFEMDGCKAFPIHHGKTTPETLLVDAVAAIKTHFMNVETKNPRFSMMALAKLS